MALGAIVGGDRKIYQGEITKQQNKKMIWEVIQMDWGKKRQSKLIVIIMFIAMLLQCMPLVTLAVYTGNKIK